MTKNLIMCRSVTSAQRCVKLLEASLIRASVAKAPRGLVTTGCAYCVALNDKLESAVALLRGKGMEIGKIFTRGQDGSYREVEL